VNVNQNTTQIHKQTPPVRPERTTTNRSGKAQLRFVFSGFDPFGGINAVWGSITQFPTGEVPEITEYIKCIAPVSGQRSIQCEKITEDGTFKIDVQTLPSYAHLSESTRYKLNVPNVAEIDIKPETIEVTVEASDRFEAKGKADVDFKTKLGGKLPVEVFLLDIATETGVSLGLQATIETTKKYKWTYRAMTGRLILTGDCIPVP